MHDRVDAAFGRFDLTNPESYRTFLIAHARALPAAERVAASVYPLRPRGPALSADLLDLASAMPQPLAFDGTRDAAAAWGALYVVEGSRLGGRLLVQQVPPDLPRRYLAAAHNDGEWRRIRAAIDAVAAGQGEIWHASLLAGAAATFDLFARAVDARA